jgi:hypothetical protein
VIENVAIAFVILAALAVLLLSRLREWDLWRATMTPLASIIGSGFLVLGPVLNDAYGRWAPAVMAGLCAVAWAFGAAVRSNILSLDAKGAPAIRSGMERLADWTLAFAYVISVAYYLNLFGAFALGLLPIEPGIWPRVVTTTVYIVILAEGWTRGFQALESMEVFSVSVKLAIILGLILGLGWYTTSLWRDGGLVLSPPRLTGWEAATLAMGLIVTVQGFETSRYLGADYPADVRVRSMRLAQGLSTVIYMVYVALLVVSFAPGEGKTSEIAIIAMMGQVAPVLPAVLVAAALAAQFSAAVADTAGAGGLVVERSGRRFGTGVSYAGLVAAGLALTWTLDVFAIIAWASRAFAAYYAMQSAIAALMAWRKGARLPSAGWMALALFGGALAVFGRAVE